MAKVTIRKRDSLRLDYDAQGYPVIHVFDRHPDVELDSICINWGAFARVQAIIDEIATDRERGQQHGQED
jgi:hypothetical protein